MLAEEVSHTHAKKVSFYRYYSITNIQPPGPRWMLIATEHNILVRQTIDKEHISYFYKQSEFSGGFEGRFFEIP